MRGSVTKSSRETTGQGREGQHILEIAVVEKSHDPPHPLHVPAQMHRDTPPVRYIETPHEIHRDTPHRDTPQIHRDTPLLKCIETHHQ